MSEFDDVPRNEDGRIVIPDGHNFTEDNAINRGLDERSATDARSKYERDRAVRQSLGNYDNRVQDTLKDLETKPTVSQSPEVDNPLNYAPSATTGNTPSKKQSSFGRFLSNRKRLIGVGVGGSSATIIVLGIMLLLPLKFDALMTNATKAAGRIPGYAVQSRTEYLVTRVLATRMLQLTYGLDDKDIEPVFCKERGAVGCSLLATYTAQRISDTMGLDMIKLPNQTVRVSINAKGRQALGGSARSWEVKLTRDWGDSGVLTTMKKIESHADMRSYLKTRVEKTYKNNISRYVARRILMMKYGVKSWRAFETTRENIDNKVADIKTEFKVGVYKNTIGKVSPRFAAYIACLQGGTTTCEEVIKNLSANLEPPGDKPRDGESQAAYERRKKQYDSLEKIGAKVRGELPDIPTENLLTSKLTKVFSTKVLASVSGVLSAIMITDTVLKAVDSVNNGVLDEIGFDMASQYYTGFAFGDETGVVTNWEKTKVGDYDANTGSAVMSEIGTLVDCDGSTLCASENGYPGTLINTASILPVAGAASAGFARECSTSDGIKQVTLAPGQLVCPERKLYRNYAGLFVDNSAFQSLAQIAKFWTASIGAIINLVGDGVQAATGWITEPIMKLFEPLGAELSKLAAPLINWFMSTVFDPPSVGYDTTPANNYDAVSGALHIEQWETMKNGVVDGQLLGGGGMYLNEEQSQKIIAYQQSEEKSDFNSQSTFAQIFNSELKGSIAQQLVLQTPNSLTGLAKLPAKALAAIFRIPSASAAAAVTSSPFGLPNYSYPVGDPALTANPSIYTQESCAASATARDASFGKQPGATVAVYAKTDPCALEKLAVGSLITTPNPSDQYAFKPLFNVNDAATPTGSCDTNTDLVKGIAEGWDRSGNKKTITICSIPGTTMTGVSLWKNDERYKGTSAAGITDLSINSEGAKALFDAAQRAKKDGVTLGASIGYRSIYEQCSIYIQNHSRPKECPSWVESINDSGWNTDVIFSNHMMGYSIDFNAESEKWMRTCMQSKSTTDYDLKGDNRCFGFWDDVNQKEGWDSAHFTYDP